ncbi:uncharacterized protein LOC111705044 [Eurytemora carolleeae]|uniref:uncharacterized protein LOC111705044 n=1 Tax=Eurytemora carolleeae TaxID=1294199 RepID=UPI000C784476|nr:uncharacterized protein LOC111705044 [Eurytemora carolleeae]|eukprot:XP_023333240.1 uncharacterized protein LOC111705044 [Eurytemora affinis]
MDVYYWQGTQEVYSPFKQNMDTVQSSFFRLSLEDLQRVSNVYSRPAFAYNRAKQSGNRVKKQHVQQEGGWSNNTWAGSTRTTTFRSPRSSHEFSSRNTVHKDNTKLPLKKDLYPPPPGPLMPLPPGEKVSPLSPSFSPRTHTSSNSSTEFSLSVSPRFNWRYLEQQVGGVSEQQLLTQLTQLHLAVNKSNLSCIRQLAADGLDLGIPLRGVTALSCSVQLGKVDVMKEILREMLISRTVQKNINIIHFFQGMNIRNSYQLTQKNY